MADQMGNRLVHVHLGDGTGEPRDEHLVPGRGNQPCAALLGSLASRGFTGAVAVEVSTRRAGSRAEREGDLTEALAFARQHLGTSPAGSGHRREDRGVGGHPDRGALAGPMRRDV
jgi:sugar phosphate isomerase/epimerase